jgi:large subunit ribosomal protein L21
MFAVIKSGGRQYKVTVGETLEVNRLAVEAGDQIRLEDVLLISDEENTMVGNPLVNDAFVLATATKHGRGKKVIVFKYKSKKRYRHKSGHRQELTFLTIDDIVASGKSLITGKAPEFKTKEVPEAEIEETPEGEVTSEVETVAEEAPATESVEEAPAPETPKRTRRRRTAKGEESETKAEETETKPEEE